MELHERLFALGTQFGRGVFDDSDSFRGALDDFLDEGAASTGDINLLVDAVRLGALRRMQDMLASGATPTAAVQGAGELLARERGTADIAGSRWACAVLGYAIGRVSGTDVQRYRTTPGHHDTPGTLAPQPTEPPTRRASPSPSGTPGPPPATAAADHPTPDQTPAGAYSHPGKTQAHPDPGQQPRPGRPHLPFVLGAVAAGLTLVLLAGTATFLLLRSGDAPDPTVTGDVSDDPAASPTAPRPSPADETETSPTGASTPAARDWEAAVSAVHGGVVRLDVASCEGRWTGSGFVVDPRHVMTTAHVAGGAASILVQSEDSITTAQVVDLDFEADAALIETAEPLTGPTLQLGVGKPALGSNIALLGYPLSVTELRVTQGIVSGLNGEVSYGEDFALDDLIVTDAAVNGGNSGGPVIDPTGEVIGLVTGKRMWVSGNPEDEAAEGTGFVVPSDELSERLTAWQGQAAATPIDCGDGGVAPAKDDTILLVEIDSDDRVARDVARSLAVHGESINRGNYRTAWEIFTPRLKSVLGSLAEWQSGVSTSSWVQLAVRDVQPTGPNTLARVELRTEQAAADGFEGQTCSRWSLTYTMVRSGSGSLIHRAENAEGSPRPC